MTAVEVAETKVTEVTLSSGLMLGIYTATTSNIDDWVVLSSFEDIYWANAFTSADGTNQEAYCSGTDGKVYLNVSGAGTIIAIGIPKESTGGD